MIRVVRRCGERPFCSCDGEGGARSSASVVDFRPIPKEEMAARTDWRPLRCKQIMVRQPFSCAQADSPEERAACDTDTVGD